MTDFFDFLTKVMHPESIIQYGGISLLLIVIFAETGLFFCFFLPGDSLLFTAGLFCATGLIQMNVILLILYVSLAAISGNMLGYAFGNKVGVLLFERKSGLLFKQKHLTQARDFYEKHGGLAIILSRFLPIFRTFSPIIAGIVKLDLWKFLYLNISGGFLWVGSLVLCGYFMGRYIPGSREYLEYIIISLIIVTMIPAFVTFLRRKRG